MSNFCVKLEDILRNSGYDDWELRYDPDVEGYFLKLDGEVIFMTKIGNMKKEKENE